MNIPNLVYDGVTPEMKRRTTNKFKKWDKIVEENWLESEDEKKQLKAYEMLEDPTIFAYAFFKDKEDKPLKFYSYQDHIMNDKSKRIMFCSSNQIGKSFSLCYMALFHALKNPGHTVVLTSKTLLQAKDLMRQINNFKRTCTLDLDSDTAEIDNKTEIYFKHFDEEGNRLVDSRIIVTPASETLLGFSPQLLLIDEFAFYENPDYFYRQIALPRVYQTKGQIIIFSNANGAQGIYYEMWRGDVFQKYRFNFLDCPTNTKEEFDAHCKELTQAEIDSTLLSIFSDAAGTFLTLKERQAMQVLEYNQIPAVTEEPYFVFFDFAKSQDRTVRTVGVPYRINGSEQVGVKVYEMKEYPEKTPYNEVIDDLENLFLEVGGSQNIMSIGYDQSGVGAGIEDFMRKYIDLGINLEPVQFSLQKKSAIYTLFKLLAERNLKGEAGIQIPKVEACNKQLSKLRFKRSNAGHLMVHHAKESDRDDYVDSIVGLCSLIVQPESAPVTLTIMNSGKQENNTTKFIDLERCECGNIWEGEQYCTFCHKEMYE